jgi:VanZ family protein
MPPEQLPSTKLWRIPCFDKMVHFGMYFILAVLLVRPLKTTKLPVWITTVVTSLFVGGVIEILQYAITNYRSASWGDFGSDIAGALIGLLVYAWMVKGRKWEHMI